MPPRQATSGPPSVAHTADRLHSAAIHLLRRLRAVDGATGLSASRLSALSVIAFGGPLPLSRLARAEQVSLPTVSRLVKDLERDGLVVRSRDRRDGRVQIVETTARGKRLMLQGRARRVRLLAQRLESLSGADQRVVARAAELVEALVVPHLPPPAGG